MSNRSYPTEYFNIHPNQRNSIRRLINLLYKLGVDKDTEFFPTFSDLNWYIIRVKQRLESDSII